MKATCYFLGHFNLHNLELCTSVFLPPLTYRHTISEWCSLLIPNPRDRRCLQRIHLCCCISSLFCIIWISIFFAHICKWDRDASMFNLNIWRNFASSFLALLSLPIRVFSLFMILHGFTLLDMLLLILLIICFSNSMELLIRLLLLFLASVLPKRL